jgi:hypothetical protein
MHIGWRKEVDGWFPFPAIKLGVIHGISVGLTSTVNIRKSLWLSLQI